MKKNILRVIKMAAFYSFLGLLLQGIIVNILFAYSPSEGQNLQKVKVTINAVNVSFENALQIITEKTEFKFSYDKQEIPLNEKVTIDVTNESLYDLLKGLAGQYDLVFQRINNQIVIKKGNNIVNTETIIEQDTGTITGSVKDARTKTGIIGANVFIKVLNIGAAADINGNFVIKNVQPGKYALTISAIGYGKIQKSVMVESGKTTEANFILDEEAVGLDEVVVTGVAFETRRKEIPADITVLTPKQIEQKNSNNLTDLLKGEIPGVFSLDNGQNDYYSTIYIRGIGFTTGSSDNAKVLIDGIEVANPQYISTIDTKSIERIEVIRGPHASALYGSAAMAGVLNIITKKGYGKENLRIDAQLSAGYIQSNFLGNEVTPSGITPLKTNNNIQISGGSNLLTYRASLGYATVGEWVKNLKSKQVNLSSGLHIDQGSITADITVLWSNRNFNSPSYTYRYQRWPGLAPTSVRLAMTTNPDLVYPNYKYDFNESTIGLNLTYQTTSNWVHHVVIGQDINQFKYWQPEPNRLTLSDTLTFLQEYTYRRHSIRYNTSYQIDFDKLFNVRLTLGGDYSLYKNIYANAGGIQFNQYGDIAPFPEGFRIFDSQERWTAGYSGILEASYNDQLFFTLSSSIHEDPRGAERRYITPPRIGLAYILTELAPFEIRVRGQYGSAIQPVDPTYVLGSVYPEFIYLPNPNLEPARRTGWDMGIEIYIDNDASFSLTRFVEEVQDEILEQIIQEGPPLWIRQMQNVGRVGISGYEVRGKVKLDIGIPMIISLNYSYSDNRIKELSNLYVPQLSSPYIEGDRMMNVPKHSGGGSIMTRFSRGSVAFDLQFSGGLRNTDWVGWYDYRYGSALHKDVGISYADFIGTRTVTIDGITGDINKNSRTRSYIVEFPSYFKFGLRADYEIMDGVTAFLNISNLFNNTTSDLNRLNITQGRVTTLGVRVSY